MAGVFAKLQQSLIKRNLISSFFAPVHYDYEEELYGLKDNMIGFGYMFQPLAGANDDLGNQIAQVFAAKGVPDNTAFNWSIYTGEDVFPHMEFKRNKLKGLDPTLATEVRNVLSSAAEREIRHLENLTRKGIDTQSGSTVKNTIGWITFSIPIPQIKTRDKKRKEKQLNEFKATVLDLKQRFESMLSQIKVPAEPLTPRKLIHTVGSILNTSESARWKKHLDVYDAKQTIDKQFCEFKTEFDRSNNDYLKIGDPNSPNYWKVITQEKLPETTSLGLSSYFLGDIEKPQRYLPGNNILSCNIFFNERESFESEVAKQKTAAYIQTKFSEPHQKQHADLEAIEKAIEENDIPAKVLFTVAVSGKSVADVKDKTTRAISHFSTLGYSFQEDDVLMPALFFSSIPFGPTTNPKTVEFFERYKKMTADQAVRFLPMSTQWKGRGKPIMSFIARNGELMSYDFFDFNSYNGIIAAQTGYGKSVASNYVIQSYLMAGAKIWAIDLGDSYRNHCEIVDGNYYDFGDPEQFNFDPFATIGDIEAEDRKNYIDMLTGVFGKMIVVNENLNDYQVAMLSKVIDESMKAHGVNAKIQHVIDGLKANTNFMISKMGEQLEVFYYKYEEYFQGENRVDLTKGHFNVIELYNLKSKPHLLKVILFQSIIAIERATFYSMRIPGEIDRMKMLLVDEAWQWILGDSSSGGQVDHALMAFLTGAYRQFRKSNSAIWMVLQSIGDAYLNPNAQPILDNSANKLMLGQDNGTIETLKADGKMSLGGDYEYDLLKTVTTVDGEYSEIFFLTDEARGIGRLSLDPYRFMMFSTKAEHKKQIADCKAMGMTTDEALRCVIGELPVEQWQAEQAEKARKLATEKENIHAVEAEAA